MVVREAKRSRELAGVASVALRCEVSRGAVVRAAFTAWLDIADEVDPEQIIERSASRC